jgi:hypothetical protein
MTVTAEVTFDEAVMTGAETVKAARGVLRRAKDSSGTWPEAGRREIVAAVRFLTDSATAHWNLEHGIIRPGDEFPGLEPGALGEALALVAEDVSKDAAVLADVIGKWCGPEAATKVRGEGEQS